jgi:hypothetical protein
MLHGMTLFKEKKNWVIFLLISDTQTLEREWRRERERERERERALLLKALRAFTL